MIIQCAYVCHIICTLTHNMEYVDCNDGYDKLFLWRTMIIRLLSKKHSFLSIIWDLVLSDFRDSHIACGFLMRS